MKTTKKVVLGIVWGIAALVMGAPARAYVLNGNIWPGSHPRIPVYVSTNLQNNIPYDGTFQQGLDAINAAINEWNTRGGSEFKFYYAGTTSVATHADDGMNVIYYKSGQCTQGTNAAAYTYYYSTAGVFHGFDIELCRRRSATNQTVYWSSKQWPLPYDMDMTTGLLHELGHAIGLDHPGCSAAMGTSCGNGCLRRTLMPDDIAGVLALYSNYSAEGFSASTTSPSWGDTFTLQMNYPVAAGQQYAILVSTTQGTFPLRQSSPTDSRILQISGNYLPTENFPTIFQNMHGVLDSMGRATATVQLPVSPATFGSALYFTVVTLSSGYLNNYEDVGVGITVNIQRRLLLRLDPVTELTSQTQQVTACSPENC